MEQGHQKRPTVWRAFLSGFSFKVVFLFSGTEAWDFQGLDFDHKNRTPIKILTIDGSSGLELRFIFSGVLDFTFSRNAGSFWFFHRIGSLVFLSDAGLFWFSKDWINVFWISDFLVFLDALDLWFFGYVGSSGFSKDRILRACFLT